jgi:tetratricopeptide (TPR) repeat protein
MGRYAEALAELDRAIEVDPKYGWALGTRGQVRHARAEYDAALADFARALELDPALNWARRCRGETYRLTGRYAEALAELDRAIAVDPNYAVALGSRAQVYAAISRWDRARADLERATAIAPGEAWLRNNLGEAYLALGDTAQALREFRKRIELSPDDSFNSLISSALIFYSHGETNLANEYFARALAALDNSRSIVDDPLALLEAEGIALLCLGRSDEARQPLSKAEALWPTTTPQPDFGRRALVVRAPQKPADMEYLDGYLTRRDRFFGP